MSDRTADEIAAEMRKALDRGHGWGYVATPENLRIILADRDAKAQGIIEQCRLNGMGAQRELALQAKLMEAERRLARYETYIGTHGTDCHLWGPRHYACLRTKYDSLAALLRRAAEALRPFDCEADTPGCVPVWSDLRKAAATLSDIEAALKEMGG